MQSIAYIFAALFFAASLLICGCLDDGLLKSLCSEDGPVESVGSAAYLTASLLLLSGLGRRSRAGFDTGRNLWIGWLALLFFICFAEEISWGQRIFGWATPEFMLQANAQGETNLHNLWIFHGRDASGQVKPFWAMMLNMSRLLSVFWLSYCILLPIAARFSKTVLKAVEGSGIPLPPFRVGMLFLVNYIAFHLTIRLAGRPLEVVGWFDELKETNYALAFLILAAGLRFSVFRNRREHPQIAKA